MDHLERLRQLSQERARLAAQEEQILRELLEQTGLFVSYLTATTDGRWVANLGIAQELREDRENVEAQAEPVKIAPKVPETPRSSEAAVAKPAVEAKPVETPKPVNPIVAPKPELSIPKAEPAKPAVPAPSASAAPKPVPPVPAAVKPPAQAPVIVPKPLEVKPAPAVTKPEPTAKSGSEAPKAPAAWPKPSPPATAPKPLAPISFLTPEQQKRKKMEEMEAIQKMPGMSLEELQKRAQEGPSGLRVAPLKQKRPNPYRTQLDGPARATRLARTLVSDIVAYRSEAHTKALKEGVASLRSTFAVDLERAKERFYEQVSVEDVQERDKIFIAAVNEILGYNLTVW